MATYTFCCFPQVLVILMISGVEILPRVALLDLSQLNSIWLEFTSE